MRASPTIAKEDPGATQIAHGALEVFNKWIDPYVLQHPRAVVQVRGDLKISTAAAA